MTLTPQAVVALPDCWAPTNGRPQITPIQAAQRHAPPCEVASRWSALLETPLRPDAVQPTGEPHSDSFTDPVAGRETEHAN